MHRRLLAISALALTLLWPHHGLAEDHVVRVQLLGFNDFHGQLAPVKIAGERPRGGAAVLAAYLRDQMARFSGPSLIVHAGDHVGASPPSSGLLKDEPAIQFLNLLGNDACTPRTRMNPRCNLVGTPGNHEFDEGERELMRLYRGGTRAHGPQLERPYRGAAFPLVSANVIVARTGAPLFAPYVIKELAGVRVGVIGAVVATTPEMVVASGVRGLRFLDEATAINRAARALAQQGIHALVVTIHQGAPQRVYEGPTRRDAEPPSGAIAAIVAALDPEIDVVISGHAHAFTNALLPNRQGAPVLVTQALSAGAAYAAIELTLDRRNGDVIDKVASIVATYGDAGPGLTPAADVAELVERAERAVAPLTERVIGHTPVALVDQETPAGESPLGNLVADAQRAATNAQIAFMNQGGVRADIDAGEITWGELLSVHPFGNVLIAMDLTGAQIASALEQQWQSEPPRRLFVSGLSYVWDPRRTPGSRVVSVRVGADALAPAARYRVVVNSFLAEGGGDFTMFRAGKRQRRGPLDLDALERYIASQPAPLSPPPLGRVQMLSSDAAR